ncbi:MAG: endonuclease V [Gaiellaceae bacterium]
MLTSWPASAEELVAQQLALARERPALFRPGPQIAIGGCFVCFPRAKRGAGEAGDPAWAAAVLRDGTEAVVRAAAGAPYEAGLLALREGPALERAIRELEGTADVMLVNATGHDHPRRAGLALHLGAMLDLPTVGVTHRALVAHGQWPQDEAGASSPLLLEEERVGYWLCTRPGTRPLAVHAGWRTDPQTALEIVLRASAGHRTPEPLRQARHAARAARAASF